MVKILFEIFKFFINTSKASPKQEDVKSVMKELDPMPKNAKVFITLNDWITSSGKYPERASSKELTDEVKTNAQDLVDRVNRLLNDIGWSDPVSISSGFRPSEVNNKVANAAKKSAHMIGKALDIYQPKAKNAIGLLVREKQNNKGKEGVLGLNGLMMESLEATVGVSSNWTHLDTILRSERPSMEFKP